MPISQTDYEAKHRRRRSDSDTDAALREMAGNRYRLQKAEDGELQVPMRGDKGHIYMHAPDTLGAYIESHRPNASFKTLKRKCPAAKIHVCGDWEIIVLHPVDGWRKFFSACGAKTRRQLSDKHREKLVEAGRQTRIKPGVQGV